MTLTMRSNFVERRGSPAQATAIAQSKQMKGGGIGAYSKELVVLVAVAFGFMRHLMTREGLF